MIIISYADSYEKGSGVTRGGGVTAPGAWLGNAEDALDKGAP